jgi:hypothetical protein
VQAGIDDAAKAAGLTAGHIESSAGAVAQKVGGAVAGKQGSSCWKEQEVCAQ